MASRSVLVLSYLITSPFKKRRPMVVMTLLMYSVSFKARDKVRSSVLVDDVVTVGCFFAL